MQRTSISLHLTQDSLIASHSTGFALSDKKKAQTQQLQTKYAVNVSIYIKFDDIKELIYRIQWWWYCL